MKMIKEQAYQQARHILDKQALAEYCQTLKDQSWIAIDTEFVRVDTYYPELCLVQISDEQQNLALIDPIQILQNAVNESTESAFDPLLQLLENPNIRKVFHSARQDVEVLYQLANRMPQNIFDTQIAAIFLKHGDLAGYARVIEQELGIQLDKSQTRTNWQARPLTEKQIHYALDDVYFLAQFYQKLQQELSDEHLSAVIEDGDAMLAPSLYETPPDDAWLKIKSIKNFKPKQLAILKTLARWREQYAIDHNQPKKWVMSDEVMTNIAKRPPKTVQALYKVPNIKSSSVKAFGETWIALLDEVFASEPESYPTLPKKLAPPPSAKEEIALFTLQALAQQTAHNYKLNISNLVHKDDLLNLIRQQHFATQAPSHPVMKGWRNLVFFAPALAFLHSERYLQWTQQGLHLTHSD